MRGHRKVTILTVFFSCVRSALLHYAYFVATNKKSYYRVCDSPFLNDKLHDLDGVLLGGDGQVVQRIPACIVNK